MDLIDVRSADDSKMLERLKVKLSLFCCEGQMRGVLMTKEKYNNEQSNIRLTCGSEKDWMLAFIC